MIKIGDTVRPKSGLLIEEVIESFHQPMLVLGISAANGGNWILLKTTEKIVHPYYEGVKLSVEIILKWTAEYNDKYVSNISDYFGKKAIWFGLGKFEKCENIKIVFPDEAICNMDICPEIGTRFSFNDYEWEITELSGDNKTAWAERYEEK